MVAVLSPLARNRYHAAPEPSNQIADLRMDAVERRMRDLTRVGVIGQSQSALRYFLQAASSRDLAQLSLLTADAVRLRFDDAVAVAASAQLVFLATRRHGEPTSLTRPTPGSDAVLHEPVAGVGDCLLSAAYAAAASISSASLVAELIALIHATISACVSGRSQEGALHDVLLTDYDVYERVVQESMAPLLTLPFELVLTRAGVPEHRGRAQHLARNLSLAVRIAADLESAKAEQKMPRSSTCLNAVDVLQNAGFSKPERIASANAFAALRNSVRSARKLPHGVAENLQPFFDRVLHRIEAASQ